MGDGREGGGALQAALDEVARSGAEGRWFPLVWDVIVILVVGVLGGLIVGIGLALVMNHPDPLGWLLGRDRAAAATFQMGIWCLVYGGIAAWLARTVRRDPPDAVVQRAALGMLSRLAPYDAGGPASAQSLLHLGGAPDAREARAVVSVFAPRGAYVRCATCHGDLYVRVTVYGYMGGTAGPAPGAVLVVERDTHTWFELTSRVSEAPGLAPEEVWRRGLDEVIARFERELHARRPDSDAPQDGARMVRGGAQPPLAAPSARAWTLRGSKRPVAQPRPASKVVIHIERLAWLVGAAALTLACGAALVAALGVAADPEATLKTRSFLGVVTLGVMPVVCAGAWALRRSLPPETSAALDAGLVGAPEARLALSASGQLTLTQGESEPASIDLTRPFVVRLHHERGGWMHVILTQGAQRLRVSAPCAGFAGDAPPSALEVEAPALDAEALRDLWSALAHYGALSEGDRGDLGAWRPDGLPARHAHEAAAVDLSAPAARSGAR